MKFKEPVVRAAVYAERGGETGREEGDEKQKEGRTSESCAGECS